MLKKLLYLYNDGHNPFPHIKGGMVGEETDTPPEFDTIMNDFTTEGNYYDQSSNYQKQSYLINAIDYFNGSPELQLPFQNMLNDIMKPDQPNYTYDTEGYIRTDPQNDYWEEVSEEIEQLDKINEENEENIEGLKRQLKGDTLEKYKGDMDKLVLMERELKKNTIRNNLEISTLKKAINSECSEIGKSLLIKSVNGEQKKYTVLNDILGTVSTKILEIIKSKHNITKEQELILNEISKVSKVTKSNDENSAYIIFAYMGKTKGDDKKYNEVIDSLQDILLSLKPFDKYNKKLLPLFKLNDDNAKMLNDIIAQKKKLQMKIDSIEVYKYNIKELQQKYRDKKEFYDKKREERVSKIDRIKNIAKSNPKQALQQIEKLEDEIEYDLSKLMAKTPVKIDKVKSSTKTAEVTQNEIDEAVVNGRLKTINGMSGDGKKLETYFTKQGQDVLHYITDDYSHVIDNEYNDRIPNFNVPLSNGETASLRKAVTLDLYSDDTVYEIKNYNEYNSKDPIPVQVTKLQGTGYFEHLYLPNGRLYNIKLHVNDPVTGQLHDNYILPINPNGYKVVVVYRLKDGVFYDEPMNLNHVTIKESSIHKTEDKKPLFKYKKASYTKMSDQYDNPSFNIQPYLKNIKDLKK